MRKIKNGFRSFIIQVIIKNTYYFLLAHHSIRNSNFITVFSELLLLFFFS